MELLKKVRLSEKGQMVIPKVYRDELGLEAGSELVILRRGDTLVLVRAEAFGASTRGRLKGIWGRSADEIEKSVSAERDAWR